MPAMKYWDAAAQEWRYVDMGAGLHVGADAPTGTPTHGQLWIDVDEAPHASVAAAGYRLLTTVYFTSSGDFIKANYPSIRAVRVKAQAGGGAGGGRTGGADPSVGAGGGGGGYVESFVLADLLAASETVTVGAGGVGVAAAAGNAGGSSSFGSHATAAGGVGGGTAAGAGSIAASGGSGGSGSGGFERRGRDGGDGSNYGTYWAGQGGDSVLGFAHPPIGVGRTGSGRDGWLYGSGGGGAAGSASNQPGGNGSPGIVIVEVYV